MRAHVTLFTSAGDVLAEETTQVVEGDLQAVGIETETKKVPTLRFLAAAGGTLDDVQRQAAYVSASQLIRADEAVIPLYQRLTVDARKTYLQG